MGNLLSFFLSSACNPANSNPPCKLRGQLPQFPIPPDFVWSICVYTQPHWLRTQQSLGS